MRVFNLTDQRVDYRGKLIPPYGSEEYDLDFIPDRDRQLEKSKMLAFGAIPKWWRKPAPVIDPAPTAVATKVDTKVATKVATEVKTEMKAVVAVEEPKVEDKVEVNFKKMKKY